MSRSFTFGIVGGYGATGKIVASELCKSSGGEILIGGRDLARAKALAAELGHKASAARLDVLDANLLNDFCSRSSIIVNCAGPVSVLQDRVAQAAFRQCCHYVDPASLGFVKERMSPHSPEIQAAGLSFVVSAGWSPGISDLLAIYAYTQAKARMENIESVTSYFADSGEWSENGLRDVVWFIRQRGLLRKPGYFHRGEWTRAARSITFPTVNIGDPLGAGRFVLVATPELEEIGRQLKDCDFFSYTYLSGYRTLFTSVAMAVLPLPQGFAVRLARNMFRRNRFPVGGFVVVHAVGQAQGRRTIVKTQVSFERQRDYWIHGVTLATVARMIAEGKGVRPGVNFLADAVDATLFMDELRKYPFMICDL